MEHYKIKPKRIDHTHLFVSDPERSKTYYEALFNFNISPMPEEKDMYMVESEHVHFFIKKAENDPYNLKEQHIAFEVPNIQKVMKKLDKMNIQTYEIGVFDKFESNNYEWIEWRDPDGIKIECVEIV
jgi:catechol 2,3-dioxygenase-like lactoylglutathione lyase family enzyme